MYNDYKPLDQPKESILTKYFRIFLVVAAYWIVSIFTVFVNKALLNSKTVNLDAPIFVAWFQCLISALICITMNRISYYFPNIVSLPAGSPFDKETLKRVLPLSILFTSMITTNNICLQYVGVAFYYISRSLTTVFNVVLTYMLLKERTSFKTIMCCALIITGFWMGVDQESLTTSFSLFGTIFGVLGSLSLSMYSIYTKKVLPFLNQEVWLLSYYNNVYSVYILLPVMLIKGELQELINYEHIFEPWFWLVMIIGGVCGFAIGFLTTLQIKVTSALTHNISGTAKACAQTIIATQWYDETKSILWWMSNLIVLLGSALYARVKQVEMSEKHHQTQKV